jgi:HSP20 family molecular chaperone IbpA
MSQDVSKTTQEATDERFYATPHVDIYENNDEILVFAELPGVSADKLRIEFHDQQLTIEGEQTAFDREKALGMEFLPTHYRRVFQVQQRVDVDKIAAQLEQGVATIHLPKAPETKSRTIQIKRA